LHWALKRPYKTLSNEDSSGKSNLYLDWPVKFMPQKILFTCLVFNDLAASYILSA